MNRPTSKLYIIHYKCHKENKQEHVTGKKRENVSYLNIILSLQAEEAVLGFITWLVGCIILHADPSYLYCHPPTY